MSRRTTLPELLRRRTGRRPAEHVPLSGLSNFRIGGPADFYFEAGTADELKSALSAARECGTSCYVIGGGTNLLFDDAGYRGLVLKNGVAGVELASSGRGLAAAAGTPLARLVDFAAANGLAGFEFLAGIPGTAGGAVFGNAGAFGRCIGEFLTSATVITETGGETAMAPAEFGFAYRHSNLKVRHDILLKVEFGLETGNPEDIRAKIEGHLSLRARKHPPRETAYAGSYFKNPPPSPDGTKRAAGWLLEQVGARELKVGGAAVYSGHCNFLINTGRASAEDVLALAAELKARVRDRFGIELEEEVIFLGANAPGL